VSRARDRYIGAMITDFTLAAAKIKTLPDVLRASLTFCAEMIFTELPVT